MTISGIGSPTVPRERLARWDLISRLRAHLLRNGNPKRQMLMFVSAATLLGLFTAMALVHLHFGNMPLRYIISVCNELLPKYPNSSHPARYLP